MSALTTPASTNMPMMSEKSTLMYKKYLIALMMYLMYAAFYKYKEFCYFCRIRQYF